MQTFQIKSKLLFSFECLPQNNPIKRDRYSWSLLHPNLNNMSHKGDVTLRCVSWQDKLYVQNKLKALRAKTPEEACHDVDDSKFATWSPTRGASGQKERNADVVYLLSSMSKWSHERPTGFVDLTVLLAVLFSQRAPGQTRAIPLSGGRNRPSRVRSGSWDRR